MNRTPARTESKPAGREWATTTGQDRTRSEREALPRPGPAGQKLLRMPGIPRTSFENSNRFLNLCSRFARVRGSCAKQIAVSRTTEFVRIAAGKKAVVSSFRLVPGMLVCDHSAKLPCVGLRWILCRLSFLSLSFLLRGFYLFTTLAAIVVLCLVFGKVSPAWNATWRACTNFFFIDVAWPPKGGSWM